MMTCAAHELTAAPPGTSIRPPVFRRSQVLHRGRITRHFLDGVVPLQRRVAGRSGQPSAVLQTPRSASLAARGNKIEPACRFDR